MKLVIVESPAKGKTIENYLGRGYKVLASYGHVRDLPKSRLGVDMKTFEPEYIIPTKARKTATMLKKEAAAAEEVILATDEDREGEAISWHLLSAANIPEDKYKRITFHEITKEAITEALKTPRKIDQNLVDAQQGRRVLDRLVGYNISPLLWKKIMRGLSAGRVQSVALRFIVEREREIEKFKPDEYWELTVILNKGKNFEAKLNKKNGETLEIKSESDSKKVLTELEKAKYIVDSVEVRDHKKNPPAPFVTSTLQQEAFRKLRFTSKKTMMLAQRLYEGMKLPKHGHLGLITYMRTDSTHLSNQALDEIRSYISEKIGANYLPESARQFKKVKGAQEAHEAIRPTSVFRTPAEMKEFLEPDELKLYELIWKRTVASQMSEEVLELTGVDVKAGDYNFRANGKKVKFDGFSKLYLEGSKEKINEESREVILPKLEKGDECKLVELNPEQKFTQPPARFTEASLIKIMEENGIGRPSTYAPTISTIKNRGYVMVENRYFVPEKIGYVVNDVLVDNFPEVFNVEFTAVMERELDDIAEGQLPWKQPIKELWHLIENQIVQAEDNIKKINLDEKTDEKCEICGKPMVIKQGRFGPFMACTGFPECKNTKAIREKVAMKCPKCEGDVVVKKTKRGRIFYGCANYPKCDFATWKLPEKDKS